MLEPFLLAVALVAYNSSANMWRPFHGAAYVPMNVAATIVLLWIGSATLDLSLRQIGFTSGWPEDALAGLALGGAFAAPVLALALGRRTRRLVADERVRDVGGAGLVYRVLVRVPVGTALFEEVAFRGVLFAAWRGRGLTAAAVGSSIAFGLWHLSPTWNMIRANRPEAGAFITVAGIAAAVAFTAFAGLGLVALREATDGLAAPIAAHAGLNSLTTFAAAVAHRRPAARR